MLSKYIFVYEVITFLIYIKMLLSVAYCKENFFYIVDVMDGKLFLEPFLIFADVFEIVFQYLSVYNNVGK